MPSTLRCDAVVGGRDGERDGAKGDQQIISEHSYKNFDMAYYDTPLDAAVVVWEKMGGHAYQLIEPIDGYD